jgi:adenylate cyclase
MTWTKPLSVWLAPALMLALAVFAILFDPFSIQSKISNGLFDAYQRHLPFAADTRVQPLDLATTDEDTMTRTTRALAAAGAAAVVFTMPPDPGPSPAGLIARLPPGSDAARAALAQLPEPGHDLAAALQDMPGVVPVRLGVTGRSPHVKARFVYRGSNNPFADVPRFTVGAAAPALVESNAAGSAAANLMPDSDGVIRRMSIAFHLNETLVPGLAAEALRVASHAPAITVATDERDPLSFLRGVGIAGLENGAQTIAADRDGGVRPHFSGAQERTLDLGHLGSLKGVIVVVGAKDTMDLTPLGTDTLAGVVAQGLDNMLSGSVLVRPSWMKLAEALALIVAGTAMILLLRFGLGWAAGLVMAALALGFYASWVLFAQKSVLLDIATPGLGLLLAFAGGAAAYIHDMRLAHAGLRMAFSDSLPRATIEKIARRPGLLNIEGETRTITYLVCGVRGLADLAATYRDDACGFTQLMQQVLTPLIDQALAHGGTIDRLTADGFAAFWNAPLDDADHALHACEAANGMAIMSSRVTDALAQQTRPDGAAIPNVEIGVGVATGSVIAGGFGGYGRMGYSVNGEAVVMAGRVQALSHQYGPAVIVSESARAAAERGFAFLEIDSVAAGRNDPPVTLYAMLGNPVMRASPKFRALTVFHDHIFQAIRKQQWTKARELIAQCRRLSGASQKLYDLHLARIAYFEKHPPGADWDGAFRPILE